MEGKKERSRKGHTVTVGSREMLGFARMEVM